MNKKISTSKKDDSEEPLIDQSSEGLKKLILKGKKKGFLHRAECEKALENEKFDDKEEFYSKVESLNIQIYDEDSEETSNEESEPGIVATEKDEDSGRTDDPVRMYLKEMGNVELLSRVGEIAIAKRIEEGKKKTADAFSKSIISMMSIQKFFEDYEAGERQIRDFIDLDTTFRSVNGEQEEFDADIPIKDEQIFNNNNDDQSDDEEKTNEDDQEDYDSEASEDNNELSIHFNSASQLSVCSGLENFACAATSNSFNSDTWYHIAVTHDDSDDQVDIYIDNERVVSNNGFPEFTAAISNADLIIGKGDDGSATEFFSGVIDEVRVLDYQSMAFAGGLMISKVDGAFPGSVTVTVYNAADSNINLAGITVMQSSVDDIQCGSALTGTLNSGSTTTTTCTVAADDMLYLADRDGDNNGGNEGSPDSKFFAIDGVVY